MKSFIVQNSVKPSRLFISLEEREEQQWQET